MQPHHGRGFSLLETLVAFTIAALSLGAIFGLFSRSTVSTAVGTEYGQALELARSLAAASAAGTAHRTGVSAQKYAWTVSVTPHANGSYAGPLALERIAVDVTWPSRGGQRSVRLDTLRPAAELPRR